MVNEVAIRFILMDELKKLRKSLKLTQKEASDIVGVPLRTYASYERTESKADPLKLERIKEILSHHQVACKDTIRDSVILILGGTGNLGHVLARHCLDKGAKEIRILSRDEKKQSLMREELNDPRLKFFIGDVRDINTINDTFKGVDYVFDAAAIKQVSSGEFYPMEAIRTNIIGTNNVITASMSHRVKKALFFSTDKAVYPINAVGMSFAEMEKNVIARSRQALEDEPTLCILRSPCIITTPSSVYNIFQQQAKEGKPVTITDPTFTRFLMKEEQFLSMVDYAILSAERGDLFTCRCPAYSIRDLARAVLAKYKSPSKLEITGARDGEKSFETLISSEERVHSVDIGEITCIKSDNRDLNYKKYFTEGHKNPIEEAYTSENARRADLSTL